MKRNNFLVFDSFFAKKLLQMGYTIVDVDPNRNLKNGVIFYFKRERDIEKDFKKLYKKYTKKKEEVNLTK